MQTAALKADSVLISWWKTPRRMDSDRDVRFANDNRRNDLLRNIVNSNS